MKSLSALTPSELKQTLGETFRELGEPSYRVSQILTWFYRKCARSFDEMTDLPEEVRRALKERFTLYGLSLRRCACGEDGTSKYLFTTEEGYPVESVLLPEADGATYCLSTASGCAFGCRFCASGRFFFRALRSGEILDQYLLVRSLSGDKPPFSGIVLMGMGEPLASWAELSGFLQTIMEACGVGARRITVSTVGLPSGIRALGKRFPQVKLAVSLHAADDALRRRLMPRASRVPLARLRAALREYVGLTGGRRITFEYVLLAGINDSEEHARRLAAYVRGFPALINLIPFNPVPGVPYRRPSPRVIERFRSTLRRHFSGAVTVRKSLGIPLGAACGQLGAEVSGSLPE